jgi:hypothetical protein
MQLDDDPESAASGSSRVRGRIGRSAAPLATRPIYSRPMRRVVWGLVGLVVALALAGPASAAKTYNDPWLEGDLAQIRVPGALDILARTPQHVIVGDVDSGARLSDPDLAPHLMRMPAPFTCKDWYGPGPSHAADPANGDFGCDFVGEGQEDIPTSIPDGQPNDPYGHGTGTAAIIAAVPNNGIEGAGVAPNARVLPIRACYGGNPDCYNEPALSGFEYGIAMGATVFNASWPPENEFEELGGGSYIHKNGNVLFVFAIGGTDQNEDPYNLCTDKLAYPNVLCVGLAEPDDSAGTVNAQESTDVSAPGYAGVPTADGSRGEFGYTSGATAHVTGAAALLRGIAPALSAPQIAQVLVSTSRKLPGYETANKADGIIDVEAAVRAVQSMEGLTTPAPGQGAAADSPDPFAAQSSGGGGGSTSGASGGTPKPAPAKPSQPKASLALVGKLPATLAAGADLKLHLKVSGPAATVTATLAHGKKKLAKATHRHASGPVTLKLQLSRKAKRGPAKLTVRIGGAKPLVRSITVTKPH